MAFLGQAGSDAVRRRADALWLDDLASGHPDAVGTKAAHLARARAARLPVLDGFVVPVEAVDADPRRPTEAVRLAWSQLTSGGSRAVVVRSSSTSEDGATSSMAGRYTSILDVRGWDSFVDAYGAVVASAGGAPMAVLVQRMIEPGRGGVLFGVDPVSGDTDRRVIVAVDGGPHELVAGDVQGREVVVDHRGRVRSVAGDPAPVLGRRDRRRLLALEDRTRRLFGGPQDVEWAIHHGRAVVLQSRPVTATAARATGPVLGPGPVAETLPGALDPLEVDLWVPPLRAAMTEALELLGDAGSRRLARSPVVVVVDRQVAVDLDLVGAEGARSVARRILDPRPPLRRLRASWRRGRLRAALPALGAALAARVDAELTSLPALARLSDDELLTALGTAGSFLRAVHAHEILAGVLLAEAGTSAAAAALDALAAGRTRGWSDDDVVARDPVVLALVAPRIRGPRLLPLDAPARRPGDQWTAASLTVREDLRLRARWLHELGRRVALELGARLSADGRLSRPDDVALLGLDELRLAVRDPAVDPRRSPGAAVAPLPARFRVATDGTPVGLADDGDGAGVPAGGGTGVGPVTHADPGAGDVLVVRNLDPALAARLPGLHGLVAETGSSLSHLAILAREQGVPVVVGLHGALERFPVGATVRVDGRTGAVVELGPEGHR